MACEYLTEATQADDKPFFLYLAYNAPHWPLNSKWAEYQKYRGKYTEGWEALMAQRFAKQKQLGMWTDGVAPAPHVGPKWESLTDKQRDDLDAIMAAYAGCIDSIDQNVGKLVAAFGRRWASAITRSSSSCRITAPARKAASWAKATRR